jgi:Right handed beta helix region
MRPPLKMAAPAFALVALAMAGCSAAPGTTAGTASPSRHATSSPASAQPAASAVTASCGGHAGSIAVSTAARLSHALSTAHPGETIVLQPRVYEGDFTASTPGTAAAPITLCGSRGAVLKGPGINGGYVLHLDHASYWHVEGFTVEGGQKGVVADGVTHDLIDGLYVHGTGDEAIHLRSFSSHNVVSHNVIRNTGLLVAFFGEGIYVGSANKNWCKYSGCQPDRSNDNRIIDNNIADTTAENIDIKEGTTGGVISGNILNGTGMVSSAATSWVNVKGNDWLIKDNTGTHSIGDGFSVHQVYPGWGLDNVFRNNKATVDGPGFGIYVQSHHLGTVVQCNNVASGAAGGMTNFGCSGA